MERGAGNKRKKVYPFGECSSVKGMILIATYNKRSVPFSSIEGLFLLGSCLLHVCGTGHIWCCSTVRILWD